MCIRQIEIATYKNTACFTQIYKVADTLNPNQFKLSPTNLQLILII